MDGHLKLAADNLKMLGDAYNAFIDLAKQYSGQTQSNDFAGYESQIEDIADSALEEPKEDDATSMWGLSGNTPYDHEGYRYNDQGLPELPHYSPMDLNEDTLDMLAEGMEMGLPLDLYINWSPRGTPDKLLQIISGKYTEL